MFTIPIVQTMRERAAARSRYSELSVRLDEAIDDLHVLADHDARAAALDRAADITAELAKLHTAAWGWDGDAAGRPMFVSLDSQAMLLHQVAATERAVINAITWQLGAADLAELAGDPADADHTDAHLDELWVWTHLAHTADPAARADALRELHDLTARHVGERAAAILTVLAEIDEHRAAHGHVRPAEPTWPYADRWSRVAIASVLAVLAVAGAVPGLDTTTRLELLAAIAAGVVVALFLTVRIRDRREVNR